MAKYQLPSRDVLTELLSYDADSGLLTWKTRPVSMFQAGRHTAAHTCARWNATFAGKVALNAKHGAGYRHGNLLSRNALAHRAIWKLVTDEDPDEIDHIDGDRSNNRWVNLRAVSSSENSRNVAVGKRNTSGHLGVRRNRRGNWQAFITTSAGMVCLGSFANINEAVAARKAAERKENFHPNHGREP